MFFSTVIETGDNRKDNNINTDLVCHIMLLSYLLQCVMLESIFVQLHKHNQIAIDHCLCYQIHGHLSGKTKYVKIM